MTTNAFASSTIFLGLGNAFCIVSLKNGCCFFVLCFVVFILHFPFFKEEKFKLYRIVYSTNRVKSQIPNERSIPGWKTVFENQAKTVFFVRSIHFHSGLALAKSEKEEEKEKKYFLAIFYG